MALFFRYFHLVERNKNLSTFNSDISMQKFIIKSTCFVLPFFIAYIFSYYFVSLDKGDLLRIGAIADNTNTYRNIFSKEFTKKIKYINFSDLEVDAINEFTILTIGDSFSQQKEYGYQNYLANDPSIKVLHYDKSEDAIQAIYNIMNGNILEKISVKYILIQSVERSIVRRMQNIDRGNKLNIEDFFKKKNSMERNVRQFFSAPVLNSFLNLLYPFDDNGFFSKVYIAKTSKKLFSIDRKNLLFYYEDLDALNLNNNKLLVSNLNIELNNIAINLKKRNIQLIVLPSPDKYDAYYESIINKEKYIKPLFFNYMDKQRKNYHYVDSKNILNDYIYKKNQKDVYFYDDTHWSPIASQLISNEIRKILFLNKSRLNLQKVHE